MQNMTDEQLKAQIEAGKNVNPMMANMTPDMLRNASKMMENMSPEQMQNMQKMAQNMMGGGGMPGMPPAPPVYNTP
jgi:hypothetical protein